MTFATVVTDLGTHANPVAIHDAAVAHATYALAGFTLLLALFTGLLWLYTWRLWRTTLRALESTEAMQIPRLVPELVDGSCLFPPLGAMYPNSVPPDSMLTYKLFNYGHSTAFIEHIRDQLVLIEHRMPRPEEFTADPMVTIPTRIVLAGKESDTFEAGIKRHITAPEISRYRSDGKPRFFLFVEVKYRDVFDCVTQETFCMKVMPGERHLERKRSREMFSRSRAPANDD